MIDLLKQAVEAAATLPDSDQQKIGRDLLVHVDKVRALRADLERGLRSLDMGRGRTVDIEELIRQARAGRGQP